MENLFPLKIEIPDRNYLYMFYRTTICFLFSHEIHEKIDKELEKKANSYHLGEIVKEGKNFSIYYLEITNPSMNFEIKINNKLFMIELKNLNFKSGDKNFLFQQFLINEKNEIKNLNCFDIYEEFEIFYRIHSEKKNINSILSLLYSSINIFINKNKDYSNLSFFLTIFMKDHTICNKEFYHNFLNILSNINKKGDLSRISKQELYNIIEYRKSYLIIGILYCIFQDLEKFKILISDDKNLLFKALETCNLLFSNSLDLFPNYAFLIDKANSINELKNILKCSNKITDFIYLLNEKKEYIIKFIENGNEILLIDFFDIQYAFNESFDECFYFTLDRIKKFENNHNKIIFSLFHKENIMKGIIGRIKEKNLIIKIHIFLYLRNEIFNTKKLSLLILNNCDYKNLDFFNNFEIIEIIGILLESFHNIKKDILNLFINSIKFENLSNELKSLFSKIKWENIFGDLEYFKTIIISMINSLKNILNYEFIFIFIDKLDEKIKNMLFEGKGIEEKKDNKEKDSQKCFKSINLFNEEIIFLIIELQKKYIEFLKDNKNMDNDNIGKIVQISSKLIYFSDKYKLTNFFLDTISIKIDNELLNEIFIATLDNYEISNYYDLVVILIKNNKFGKIYNYMLDKFYEKFEKLLNQSIIDEKNKMIFEND